MTKLNDLVELLRNLMLSTVHNDVQVSKDMLCDIQSCLQNAKSTINFLELESQLQRDELQKKTCDSELVFVQNNNLFEPDHQSKNDQRNEVLSSENLDAVRSVDVKPVIRPWEEMTHNKHRIGLGYNNDIFFHIPDFAKLDT